MQTKLTLFLLLAASCMQLSAQNTIVGKVVDKNKQPIVGVLVTPTDGGTTVATDFDGQFEIAVEEGVSLSASTMGYRTTSAPAAQDMVLVLSNKGMKDDAPGLKYGWRTMFMLNYAFFPKENSHQFGFTLGQCRVGGWYISAMLGTGYNFAKGGKSDLYFDRYQYEDYTQTYFSPVYDSDREIGGYPIFTGKTSIQYASATAGFMIRLGIPLYCYAGAGYAYQSKTYQTTDGTWIGIANHLCSTNNHMLVQCGLIGNIKGFTLSAGSEFLFGYDMYEYFGYKGYLVKAGVGFALPNPKMNERHIAKKGGAK